MNILQSEKEELERELEQVENDLAKAIKAKADARELGDLRENAEHEEATATASSLERRKKIIKRTLAKSKVIHPDYDTSKVGIGHTVVLKASTGEQYVYTISTDDRGNPMKGKISFKSLLGSRIKGKVVGSQVHVNDVTYTVEDIRS